MKLPNFTLVYEGRKQATLEFSLSLSLKMDIVVGNSAPGEFACI